MKTYFDGEERTITEIREWGVLPNDITRPYWCVYYTRGTEFHGSLLVQAKDELDAMRRFPAELERQSKNYADDVEY